LIEHQTILRSFSCIHLTTVVSVLGELFFTIAVPTGVK